MGDERFSESVSYAVKFLSNMMNEVDFNVKYNIKKENII